MNVAQYRNVAVTLAGTLAFVFLSDLAIIAGSGLFEVDHPTLFARLQTLWSFLLVVVPGVGIGFFVTQRAVRLSIIAYVLGELISFYRHNGFGSIADGSVLPERQYFLYGLRDLLIVAGIGSVMGVIGAWFRHRLQSRIVSSKR